MKSSDWVSFRLFLIPSYTQLPDDIDGSWNFQGRNPLRRSMIWSSLPNRFDPRVRNSKPTHGIILKSAVWEKDMLVPRRLVTVAFSQPGRPWRLNKPPMRPLPAPRRLRRGPKRRSCRRPGGMGGSVFGGWDLSGGSLDLYLPPSNSSWKYTPWNM